MRLFLYVFRDFVKYVVGTLVLCVFLFVLFDFIHKTTKYFAQYKPSSDLVLQLYLYQLPTHMSQALPIASLLASVITMVLLSRSNEITAMRAAGMGPLRIGLPLAVGGLLLSCIAYVVNERVIPKTSHKLHYIQDVQIEGGQAAEVASHTRWQRRGNLVVSFRDYDIPAQRIIGLNIVDVKSSFQPDKIIEAASAKYSAAGDLWDAEDILITYFSDSGAIDFSEHRKSMTIRLNIDPKKLMRDRRTPEEMSIKELKEVIARGERNGSDTLAYQVDLQVKLAYPLAAFVVSLIGLKFGYRSERTTETARSILLAFLIGISYWFVLNAFKALGKRGTIPPFLAGWFADVFIFAVVMVQAWRSRRD
jgi:lipopolysaccharide export system permease protein